MADETMFARLMESAFAELERQLKCGATFVRLEREGEFANVDGVIHMRWLVRALLAELRKMERPILDEMGRKSAGGVASWYSADLMVRAMVDAILAEAGGSGGA